MSLFWEQLYYTKNGTQHNYNQHKDTQFNNRKCDTHHIDLESSVIIVGVDILHSAH